MIPQNKAEFKNMNLDYWHSKGYTGKGTNVVVLDVTGKPFKENNIINPLQYLEMYDKKGGHKTMVCAVLREMLPDATIYAMRFNSAYDDECIDWIIKNKNMIDVVNCSFSTTTFGLERLMRLKDTDIPIMISVGNDGKPKVNKTAQLPFGTNIGAWQEYGDRITSYSNYGEDLDFMGYSHINYISPNNGNVVSFSGTSCSAPVASALISIYGQHFREIMGRKMTRQETFEFQLRYVDDKLTSGRDDESGYGLLRLPDHIPELKKHIQKPEEPEKEIDIMKFTDIKGHWAEQEIEYIAEKGYINGYEDGTFKPDKVITRAEICTMLAKMEGFVKKK
ncbi:MAG TPA: S-layer homology domain-containing protein [Tissierellaceae bacterium]|nr:S-layer homology domain-containing protein [Tissierellaceae bacterium]